MTYQPLALADGKPLKAEHLAHIEAGITGAFDAVAGVQVGEVSATVVDDGIDRAVTEGRIPTPVPVDLTPYALKTEIPAPPNLSPYALAADVPPPVDLDPYALRSELPEPVSIAGLATETYVQQAVTAEAGKGPALAPWHAALADRDFAPARWLPLGDSITEGGVVSSPSRRWINRTLVQLRQRFQTETIGAGGGFGYRPAYYEVPGQYMGTSEASYTGTQVKNDAFGLGRRTAQMTAGATRTYTFTGTSFTIFYAGATGTGDLSVTIDGGTPVTVDTTKPSTRGGHTWSSPALTSGNHTVVLRVLTGGDVYLEGIAFFNGDERKGIQQFDAAHWGYKSGQFRTNLDDLRWWESVPAVAPHLVTIAAMTNDYQGNVPPATVRANYEHTIGKLREVVADDPAFVLIVWPARQDVTAPAYPWSAYVEMCHALAADDPGVTVLDLSKTMPLPGSVHGLWAPDRVHLSNRGAAWVADRLVEFLTP